MRKITAQAVAAFESYTPMKLGNTEIKTSCNGGRVQMYLQGNLIAERGDYGVLRITNAGWFTATTKERLNGIKGVCIFQKNGKWFLNGREWDGQMIEV